ncbi:hypothetical protein QNO21_07325 [Microbacterium sp. zg-Y818]|uniref:hypothetical protein n=1 Tax=unclassified Microbacterium TaxID=2609290 RepID=UPI00214C51E3|nr:MULTISPECIES: hypothetical protein [unclassified Microbacterium]MCR2801115.1 hypothetical protein [Microbacterium sp. zg.Y818]WIM23815.1 hypothetical protein QNO21_07325 [Microbacterium sp. zg-Y818]
MPDRTTMPDFSDELLRLRRRAYGPAADGELDAAGLTRLRELEALAREQSAPTPTAGEPDETMDAAGAAPAPAAVAPHDGGDDGVGGDTLPDPDIVAMHARSGGPRAAAIAAAAVVGCALVGAGMTVALAPPAPDHVLKPVQETGVPDHIEPGWLDHLGLDPGARLVAYEPHRGIQAHTFTGSGGDGCLMVSIDDTLLDFACGRGRLDATVDLMPGRTVWAGNDPKLLTGLLVRMVARDGVVEVWVEEPAP